MTRRRHQRFAVTSTVTGVLEVLEDAAMESDDGMALVITTRSAPVVGHEATLHFKGAAGTQSIRVRVVESQLHMAKDGVRHRVRLTRLGEATDGSDAPDAAPAAE